MKITRELLDKIAHLARLEMPQQVVEKMLTDMSAIITWVEKLNEVDTTGVEPLTTMSTEINALREDEAENKLTREQALRNAPKQVGDYFSVPKVIE
ncbi:MAG: Asp-tRNA(Asn)/Glu-tRNA(Gln) amidotransferase subunit GatC [Cyclobacteriaceae bacterium]|nr:Asp-tRNA(Asn)/Glu-tRNA(Gln) amidotransferase subunit GatC [Cyclobacteriaceae bacterium]UYN87463.1 MAG: Asp-tRNA(Asn)/Glu-tRNA(Gln) amidotransferase subunit GatC [Cyclobacteriaceae bacterium]